MIVADSTVLIVLSKLGRLDLLKGLYEEVLVGPVVKVEVVDRGRQIGAMGVEQLEMGLEEGWLQVEQMTTAERMRVQRLQGRTNLDPGESEALILASSRGLPLIVDDKEARAIARTMGLEHLGIAGVLLEGYRRGQVSLSSFETIIRDLGRVMWLSPDVIADMLKRAREEEQP